jgi:hypothetical protein
MGVAQDCKSKCFACGKKRKLVAFTTFRIAPGKNGRKGVCEECKEKEAETNEKALLEYRRTYNKTHTERQLTAVGIDVEAWRAVWGDWVSWGRERPQDDRPWERVD